MCIHYGYYELLYSATALLDNSIAMPMPGKRPLPVPPSQATVIHPPGIRSHTGVRSASDLARQILQVMHKSLNPNMPKPIEVESPNHIRDTLDAVCDSVRRVRVAHEE